ncbi:MAG: hypothetical protein R8K20_02570 [Gallionellaceae bacterium]
MSARFTGWFMPLPNEQSLLLDGQAIAQAYLSGAHTMAEIGKHFGGAINDAKSCSAEIGEGMSGMLKY